MRFRSSRTVGWVFIAIIAGALVVLVLVWREPLPRIQMADGSELQVLKIEVGTNSIFSAEPRWKQVARKVLPDRLEVALIGSGLLSVPTHRTRRESLMVWCAHRSADGRPVVDRTALTRTIRRALLVRPQDSPDGAIPGVFGAFPGLVCLEFRHYRREASRVPLVIWNGEKDVPFEIPNPRQIKPEKWTTGTIPQTNRFPGTEIVLQRATRLDIFPSSQIALRLLVRSRSATPAGWIEWRITAMDPLGNWTDAGYPLRSPNPHLAWSCNSVWRIQAEGLEYLSEGFLPPMTNGTCIPVPVSERAKHFGVRSLLAVGPGAFRIANGIAKFRPEIAVDGLSKVEIDTVLKGKAQVEIDLVSPYAGVLCVTEGDGGFRARVRVEEGRNEFSGPWSHTYVEVDGKHLQIHFFARKIPTEDEPLKVEVFGPLPAAEFFLPATESP